MTKSVMNALAGILVMQGRLALDAPVLMPEWQQKGDARASITLDHLLRMSSGLRFEEAMASPRSDLMRMLFEVGDGRSALPPSHGALINPHYWRRLSTQMVCPKSSIFTLTREGHRSFVN
jgi:CubicO group peptidase (beta-lactamase class C family)